MSEASIQYELGQHGWSRFDLSVGPASINVGPFGYCTDALGDLVRAALMIATSGSQAEVSFDGETKEWHLTTGAYWEPSRQQWTDFRLRVFVSHPSGPADRELAFEAQCSADSFVNAVLHATQAIWDEHGADGYIEKWDGQHGFPLRALTALKAAISVQEPKALGW